MWEGNGVFSEERSREEESLDFDPDLGKLCNRNILRMSDQFRPKAGRLGQLITESAASKSGLRLEFFIEIDFAEAEIDGETVTPFFRASQIAVPVQSWSGLANTEHEFPWTPKPGSVDAAMLLYGIQNPADVVALRFGEIDGEKIIVSFKTEVDFEVEADRDKLGQIEIELSEFALDIQPLRISTNLEKRCDGDPDGIGNAISAVVDLSDYGPVTKAPGGFILEAKG